MPQLICGALFCAPLLLLNGTAAPRSVASARTVHGVHVVGRPRGDASRRREPEVAPRRLPGADHDHDDGSTGDDHDHGARTDDDHHGAAHRRAGTDDDDHGTAAPATTDDHDDDGATGCRANSESGEATWYSEAPSGMCASPTLPFGTVITVVNDVDRRVDHVHGGRPRGCRLPAGGRHVARGLLSDRRPRPGSGGRHNLLVTHSGADIAPVAGGARSAAQPGPRPELRRRPQHRPAHRPPLGRRPRHPACSRSGPVSGR